MVNFQSPWDLSWLCSGGLSRMYMCHAHPPWLTSEDDDEETIKFEAVEHHDDYDACH